MQPFHWSEILLFLWPILILTVLDLVVKPRLTEMTWYRPSLAELTLPTLWVAIHCLSVRLFGFSLGVLAIYLGALFLIVDLYDYIRKITEFHYRSYCHQMGRVLFLTWSSFILGLGVVRILGNFF